MALNTYPYSPFPASTEQLHKGDNEELQAQIDAIKDGTDIDSFGDVETALGVVTGNITNLENDKADLEVVAAEFDAEAGTYDVGDLVTHEGKLYEFTSAHDTPGAWDPTEVTEKTVSDEIDTLKSGLNNKQDDLSLGVMINNLNIAGVGCCNYDENATNAPDTATGIVVTFRNTWNNMVFGLQIAYTRGTPQKVFIRHEWNGGYGNWKEISIT